jgi:hypothetical protein
MSFVSLFKITQKQTHTHTLIVYIYCIFIYIGGRRDRMVVGAVHSFGAPEFTSGFKWGSCC